MESVTEDLRIRFSEETLWLYGLTIFIPAQMMKEDFQDIETKNRIMLTLKKVAKKFHPLLNVDESIVEQIVSSEYHLWRRKWERDREGILPKNALATLDAVSYTHLDVYKRQILLWFLTLKVMKQI